MSLVIYEPTILRRFNYLETITIANYHAYHTMPLTYAPH